MTKENPVTNSVEPQSGSGSCQERKQKEYLERYRLWSNNSIQQLSFSNNLLLTVAIAVFGYFLEKREKIYTNIIIDKHADVDCVVFSFLLGSFFLSLSIISGTTLSISRLYDFRLTRHISLIRKRVCQKAGEILLDEGLNQPSRKTAFVDLLHIFFNFEEYAISWTECQNVNDNFKAKFKELRKVSLSLGKTTWFLFNWQFVSFLVGILLYTFVIVFM